MNHFRPLMTQWFPSWRAVAASMPGSDPAPPGSVMEKQERMSPAARGRSHCAFCSSLATTSSRCMLPSSGAAQLSAWGPSSEYPAASNTTAIERMSSPRPPHSSPTCGASSPASLAFAISSRLSESSRPCSPSRGSPSYGMTTSRMKDSVRASSAASSGVRLKSITGRLLYCPDQPDGWPWLGSFEK